MSDIKYTIGIDYGTLSGRALLVRVTDGWSASVERFEFTGDPDRGSLTNYRLK